jgi:hypothetical protein
LEAIREIARDRSDAAPEKFGARADAVQVGIAELLESIVSAFDVAKVTQQEESRLDIYKSRVDSFCRGFCAHSRQLPPGRHERCERCPLAPLTVEALTRQLQDAMT